MTTKYESDIPADVVTDGEQASNGIEAMSTPANFNPEGVETTEEVADLADTKAEVGTVEGLELRLVGCGIPDIPLLTVVILRSLYEISTNYGYDYTKPEEQLYQLLIIRETMSYGDNLKKLF